MLTKYCYKCKLILPIEDFHKDKSRPDGLDHRCKTCVRERQKQNKDYLTSYQKEWRDKNPLKRKAITKRWYMKIKQDTERWNRRKKIKAVLNRNRKARLKSVEGSFTIEDITAIYENQKGQCFYCNFDLEDNFEIDHKIPVSRGGTNWPDNLALTAKKCKCNQRKKD